MKKIIIFLLLFPLILGLVSCKSSTSPTTPPTFDQNEVDAFKELLYKQDLSDFTSKGLATMFIEEYDVLDVYDDADDEEERTSSYFNYIGLGFLDMYYVLTTPQFNEVADEKGDVNTFDAIAVGAGGYRITQSVKTAAFSRKGGESSTIKNLDISQQMTLKTTFEDAFLYNVLDVSDTQVFDYTARQNFNGAINKKVLFGSISTRAFREIFSQVSLFDAPGNVEHLDKLYFSVCKDLKTKSDKEISDFIKENQISIEEVEDNLELSFVFQKTDLYEDYIDYVFPGAIKGTLIYDKTTGSFDEFSYEIKYVDEKYDEQSGSIKTANMSFTCMGRSGRGSMGSMWTPDDMTVYDNAIEFLEKVSEEVIPPSNIR